MATVKPLKEPLKEPIWDKQEVESDKDKPEFESPKQRFFFNLFCRHGGYLSHFAGELEGKKRGHCILGVTLKYTPYSQSTLKDLCAAHKWIERRTAKDDYIHEYRIKQYDLIDDENAIEMYELKADTEYEAWVKINDLVKKDPKFMGGRFKDATQGANNIQANKNTDKEKPTDYSKQKVEAEVEAGVETNLNIEDNQALATVQTMFMQPEFVEMNKKLMEKTADELQKRRNRDE